MLNTVMCNSKSRVCLCEMGSAMQARIDSLAYNVCCDHNKKRWYSCALFLMTDSLHLYVLVQAQSHSLL